MKLNKGMRRDEALNEAIPGSWRYARDLSLSLGSQDLINDLGNTYYAQVSGRNVFSYIKANNRVILFSVESDGITENPYNEIGIFDGTTYTSLIKSLYLDFNTSNPIIGVFGYDFNNDLIIVFTDATQEVPTYTPNNIRYLNVDTLPFELDGDLELVNPSDIYLLNLCPEFKTPIFNYRQTQYIGGNLLSGVYYYFIQYEIFDGFFGEWISNSQPVIVHPSSNTELWETIEGAKAGSITSKSIEIDISNTDTRYKRYRIAFVSKIDGIISAKIIAINNTSNNVFIHTGNEVYQDVSIDEIFTRNSIYTKSKSLTILDSNLYLGGPEIDPEIRYQKYANNIKVNWIALDSIGLDAYVDSYKNPYFVFNMKTFMPGEIYALYGRFRLKNGQTSKLFHIPGRAPLLSDIADSEDSVAQSIYSTAKKFHLENTATEFSPGVKYGEMGYWENASESYPDSDEFNSSIDYDGNPLLVGGSVVGKDLRQLKVRHHKFPSLYTLKDWNIPFLHHNDKAIVGVGNVEISGANTYNQKYIGTQEKSQIGNVKVLGFTNTGTSEYTTIRHDLTYEPDYDRVSEPTDESHRWYTVIEATQKILVDYTLNIHADFHKDNNVLAYYHKIKAHLQLIKKASDDIETILEEVWDTNGSGGAGVETVHIALENELGSEISLYPGDSLIIRGSCWTETQEEYNPIPYTAGQGFTGNCKYVIKVDSTPSTELATILGLQLDPTTVYFPDYIKEVATHFEILYAKRTTGNSTVLGQAMITTVDTNDGYKYCREHSFDLISTLAGLNVTHAERMLKYDYTEAGSNTIIYNTDPTADNYVIENQYDGLSSLVKITESKYMQRDNSYIVPSNAGGEDYIYHRGIFDDNDDVPVNDATDKEFTLANFCSFKLNVYNSFFNQQVVKTTGVIDINSLNPESYNIYGGDCHVSLYGVTRYFDDTTEHYPAPNEANHKNKFWYFLYPCYSVANIGLQHRGKEIDEFAFPYFNLIDDVLGRGATHIGLGAGEDYDPDTGVPIVLEGSKSLWSKIRELSGGSIIYPKDFPQWIGYNYDYNSPNDIESILPIFDPSLDDNYKFPYRVASSLILPSGGQFVGWRIFPISSYIEMPKDKGIIWNIISDGSDLLVSMKYALFRFRKKDTLDINDTEVVALGSANLFDSKPEPIMDTNDGYVGNQCQFASPSSLHGILFIDRERGKIFLYNEGRARELSALGMTNWFNTNLNYVGTDDNPFIGNGIQAIWSPTTERYIIVKNSTTPYTISFSPNLNYMEKIGYIGGWLSFHSYHPKVLFELSNYIYTIISVLEGEVQTTNAKIYRHTGTRGNYYGIQYDSKIDPMIATPENVNKLFDSFQWATTIKDNLNNPLDETFNKILVCTNDRHSGLITLVKSGFGTGNTRLISGEWRFSEFRDILYDKETSIINDSNIDELLYESVPVLLQYTDWKDKSMFKCPYVLVRLIFTNTLNKSLMFHDFSVNATPRKRF